MFQKNNKVEDGRVRAHETAETAAVKVHEIIDKVAEQTEHGGERAQEFKAAAAEQAATTRETAATRAAQLREQAEEAKKDAKKTAKKRRKAVAKDAQKRTKKARKAKDDVSKEVARTKDDLGKDVADAREKFVGTASSLAAAGVAAGRKAADEAVVRGPEVLAALRDGQDPSAALEAAKGNVKPRKQGRKRKLLLLAVVAGGVAAVAAKQKQGPKKDPWAVPTGDPYKAPSTGRDSSVAGGLAATGVAPAAEAADAASAEPVAPVTPTEASAAGQDQPEGTDAWTNARDWADNSAIPSTTDGADHADLTPDHLDGDLPVEGDNKL